MAAANGRYDPHTFRALTFHDAALHFRQGSDTPRAYLERCLETIAAREPEIEDLADFLQKLGAKVRGAGTSGVTPRLSSRTPPRVTKSDRLSVSRPPSGRSVSWAIRTDPPVVSPTTTPRPAS